MRPAIALLIVNQPMNEFPIDAVYLLDVKDRRFRGVWKVIGHADSKIHIKRFSQSSLSNSPDERFVTPEFLRNVATPLLRDDSCLITDAGSLTMDR